MQAKKTPWYTSDDLIEAVKRKSSFPLVQQTFTENDILEFASEELFLSQVPGILIHHEEYFVHSQEIPLETNVSRYDLPNRAIGMKLRDLFYQDTNGVLQQMANIGLGNSDAYSNGSQQPRFFYIEGDDIVLVPEVRGKPPGKLVAKYYMRPNSLVRNERAAICTGFVKNITIVNTSIVAGQKLTIGETTLTAGTDFDIGVSSLATATNLSNRIALIPNFQSTIESSVILVTFKNNNTKFISSSVGIQVSPLKAVKTSVVPEHFDEGMKIDFLQTGGGHKTHGFDIPVAPNGVGIDSVYFNDSDIPAKFQVGDYICEQNECIIPQIPSDLHTLLAERTCSRILESQGDVQGAQSNNARIADLEQRQSVIIDRRVDGAPRKVVNRNSFLRTGKTGRRRRF